MNVLRKWLAGSSRTTRRSSKARLQVETLEQRQLMSTTPGSFSPSVLFNNYGSYQQVMTQIGNEGPFTVSDTTGTGGGSGKVRFND
jgi:hypothetical protein